MGFSGQQDYVPSFEAVGQFILTLTLQKQPSLSHTSPEIIIRVLCLLALLSQDKAGGNCPSPGGGTLALFGHDNEHPMLLVNSWMFQNKHPRYWPAAFMFPPLLFSFLQHVRRI